MDAIEKLSSLFEKFPGIGPRQARRFVHFLLRSSPALRREITQTIASLERGIKQCADCRRFFSGTDGACAICRSSSRDKKLLIVVASDSDIESIENANTYNGTYFVLGGIVALDSKNPKVPNEQALLLLLSGRRGEEITEMILALPANPEGDATEEHVRRITSPILEKNSLRMSVLGRGLSTGSEIEYADSETIKNALENRH